MTYLIYLAAALIPVIFLLMRVYQLDQLDREPPRLLLKLLLLGMAITFPVYWMEVLGGNMLFYGMGGSRDLFSDPLYLALDNFLIVAVSEELCKFLALKLGSWKSEDFNYYFDGILYAVIVSMGFAAVENVRYVFAYGLGNAVARAVTSLPAHCIFGIYMGSFYAEARHYQKQGQQGKSLLSLVLAVLIPVILHGFYDFVLSVEGEWTLTVFHVYLTVLFAAALYTVRRSSRNDLPL